MLIGRAAKSWTMQCLTCFSVGILSKENLPSLRGWKNVCILLGTSTIRIRVGASEFRSLGKIDMVTFIFPSVPCYSELLHIGKMAARKLSVFRLHTP